MVLYVPATEMEEWEVDTNYRRLSKVGFLVRDRCAEMRGPRDGEDRESNEQEMHVKICLINHEKGRNRITHSLLMNTTWLVIHIFFFDSCVGAPGFWWLETIFMEKDEKWRERKENFRVSIEFYCNFNNRSVTLSIRVRRSFYTPSSISKASQSSVSDENGIFIPLFPSLVFAETTTTMMIFFLFDLVYMSSGILGKNGIQAYNS